MTYAVKKKKKEMRWNVNSTSLIKALVAINQKNNFFFSVDPDFKKKDFGGESLMSPVKTRIIKK